MNPNIVSGVLKISNLQEFRKSNAGADVIDSKLPRRFGAEAEERKHKSKARVLANWVLSV
jgi:hypothetical protein